MGTLSGKVAFITGAARGQGRAHAIRLAQDGADIIGIDICADIATMDYPNASKEDLAETVRLVEAAGGRMESRIADVRDREGLSEALQDAAAKLGDRLDIIIANAGIVRLGDTDDRAGIWRDTIDVNLTGAWNTLEVALPLLLAGDRGGSIVLTSSSAGIKATGTDQAGAQAYAATKRALISLVQTFAVQYAPQMVRVNSIHPTGVRSGMTENAAMDDLMARAAAGEDTTLSSMRNALPIDILDAEDIANTVAWLVSDQARFITGVALPLDAGFSIL